MQAFTIKTNKSDYPFLVIADGFKSAVEVLHHQGIYDTDIISVQQMESVKSDHILIEKRLTDREILREEVRRELQEPRPEFDARAAELIANDGDKRLSDLGFPNRIMNALADVGIRELNDLLRISRKSLLKPKGMGPKSIKFIDEYYKGFGFHYGEEELLPDPSRKLYNGFLAYKLPPCKDNPLNPCHPWSRKK